MAVSLSVNIWMYAAFAFLANSFAIGMYTVGFVIGVEFVGAKYRTWAANCVQIAFPIGELVLALIAWRIRQWRTTEAVIAVLAASLVLLAL